MPCRDFGHCRPNVRVHQARDCRPVVAINFVLSFLKGPTLLGISSLSAMCIENLEGDYYIPGSIPDGAEGIWKEAQAWSRLKTINSWKQCHVFYLDHFRSYLISFLCDRKRLNHRWSCGQTVWCRTTTAKLPRMPVRSKRLGWWLGSKFIESPNWMCSIIEKFFENPWTEIGSAWCISNARHLLPVLLHELAAPEDGGPTWKKFFHSREDQRDVGSWVPWLWSSTVVRGLLKIKKPHDTQMLLPNPWKSSGI